jgi:hypothetical protein
VLFFHVDDFIKRKLSQLTAPALAGVVKEKSAKAATAQINNCVYDGADMIDLHLSCLETTGCDELKKIITVLSSGHSHEDCTEIYNQLCDDPAFPMGTVFDWREIK